MSVSHDDLCRLSRAFNEIANLATPQDYRINEWLKSMITNAKLPDSPKGWDPIYGVRGVQQQVTEKT